jgi:hypothetical protein
MPPTIAAPPAPGRRTKP